VGSVFGLTSCFKQKEIPPEEPCTGHSRGFGAGASVSNKEMALVVIKEYATGEVFLTATTSTLFALKLRA
jgi:hypothetical protein